MKVVLIDAPPITHIEKHDNRSYPHLGLAYIAAYLQSKNIDVQVIDAKFSKLGMQQVEAQLLYEKPDVIGLTAMTHEINQAAAVAAFAKANLKDATLVIGGVHATALPEHTIKEFPCFDFVVYGEGEITFHELIMSLNEGRGYEDISGIVYRAPDGIRKTGARGLILDLDELPYPAWGLFPRADEYPIMMSRGCPFKCNFCMRVMGNKLRSRSAGNVFAELEKLIRNYGAQKIHFLDETLTIHTKRLNELLEIMLQKGLEKEITWDAQSRSDAAEYSLFKKMRDAGCTWLGFGVESGNPEILEASGKAITLAQVENAVKLAKKAGIKTDGYFILGHPNETSKTASDTTSFAAKLNPTRITIGIMTPYPGTDIYEMAIKGEGGYKLISTNWSDYNKNVGNSLEMTTLSRKDLEKLQMLGYVKFYLYNFRFIAGVQYFLSQWRLGLSILKKFLFSRSSGK